MSGRVILHFFGHPVSINPSGINEKFMASKKVASEQSSVRGASAVKEIRKPTAAADVKAASKPAPKAAAKTAAAKKK